MLPKDLGAAPGTACMLLLNDMLEKGRQMDKSVHDWFMLFFTSLPSKMTFSHSGPLRYAAVRSQMINPLRRSGGRPPSAFSERLQWEA